MPNFYNIIFTWFFSFVISVYSVTMLFQKEYIQCLEGILVILVIFLITYKYNRLLKGNLLLFLTNLFIFTAAYLGLILELYRKVFYYDLIMHFYAGIVLVLYGFLIYGRLKTRFVKFNNRFLLYILIFFFSVTLLLVWECLEYILDLLFQSDHMNSNKTGVNDTMTDLIIGMVGSIITLYYQYQKHKKANK